MPGETLDTVNKSLQLVQSDNQAYKMDVANIIGTTNIDQTIAAIDHYIAALGHLSQKSITDPEIITAMLLPQARELNMEALGLKNWSATFLKTHGPATEAEIRNQLAH